MEHSVFNGTTKSSHVFWKIHDQQIDGDFDAAVLIIEGQHFHITFYKTNIPPTKHCTELDIIQHPALWLA